MSSIAINPGFTGRATGRPVRGRVRPAAAPASSALRLTRRGRIVVTLLFLVLVMAVLTVFGTRSAATGSAGVPVQTRTVEIAQGDTLWGIASQVAAPGQTREMVLQIEELNALPGPALVEGQKIAVPVR
jgi:LysM repeat protein